MDKLDNLISEGNELLKFYKINTSIGKSGNCSLTFECTDIEACIKWACNVMFFVDNENGISKDSYIYKKINDNIKDVENNSTNVKIVIACLQSIKDNYDDIKL